MQISFCSIAFMEYGTYLPRCKGSSESEKSEVTVICELLNVPIPLASKTFCFCPSLVCVMCTTQAKFSTFTKMLIGSSLARSRRLYRRLPLDSGMCFIPRTSMYLVRHESRLMPNHSGMIISHPRAVSSARNVIQTYCT